MKPGCCAVKGCPRDARHGGICPAHYLRCRRHLAPGEVGEKLSSWKHGVVPWPEWLLKPFGAPRGVVVREKPAPETPAKERDPRALQTTLRHSVPPNGVEVQMRPSAAGILEWKREPAAPLRPSETRVHDPVLRQRVEVLRDVADFLARQRDHSATKRAVLELLRAGTNGVPFHVEEKIQALERAVRADGWIE